MAKFYCQREIEMNPICKIQCSHCKEYYKPLESNKMQFLNFETNKMEDVKYFAIQNGIVLGIIEDSDKWYTYYFIMEHKKIFDSFTNDNRSQLCLISNEKGEPYKVFKTSFDSIGFEFTKDYEVIRKLIFGERKAIVENSY